MSEYNQLRAELARGWNTWITRSVLSHVLLPDGLAILRNRIHSRHDGAGPDIRTATTHVIWSPC